MKLQTDRLGGWGLSQLNIPAFSSKRVGPGINMKMVYFIPSLTKSNLVEIKKTRGP